MGLDLPFKHTRNSPGSVSIAGFFSIKVNLFIFTVPTEPPKNLKLQATQPSQMYVKWDNIAYNDFNGIPLGYLIKYKHYHEPNYHEVKVLYGASDITLYDLKGYRIYVVIVYGYTAVGIGPGISLPARTLEGGMYHCVCLVVSILKHRNNNNV